MQVQLWPVLQNNNKPDLDVYQASFYFNWKSCVDVVAVVTINHLGVFLSNCCAFNAPKNLISSGALLHFLKKKENKTKQEVLQTCIRGDRRNWENSVDQETESKCLLTTEHEHLHLHWRKERKLLLEMNISCFVGWICLLAIKYSVKWYKYVTTVLNYEQRHSWEADRLKN